MARQPYFVNTSQKQMEVFGSYEGGMVTQSHPEKLRDNQSVLIENANLVEGGILEARGGYSQTNKCDIIQFNTFDDFADENITMDTLKNHTLDHLKNEGLLRPNIDDSKYYTTLELWETENITFNNLKEYTFDQLKNQGVLKPNTGSSQGMFRYYSETGHTDIIAIKGKLYKVVDDVTYKKVPIKGLKNFQTTRNVEAVQYRDKLYIATGSGLVSYDGKSASLVQAYAPNGLEALYVGTNGYAEEPSSYLSDTTGSANLILGVVPNLRYGLVNQSITFTAYVQKVELDSLEYKFEVKKTSDNSYTLVRDWGLEKTITHKFTEQSDYMIQVSVRKLGTEVTLSPYILPRYTVNTVANNKEEDDGINFTNIASCNRIFVHYDRLFLYGDLEFKDYLYVSHLEKFNYFPRTNTLKITDPLRGSLQCVARYKNMLLCWTNGSIQMITGTSPADFQVQPVHTTLGTLYGQSVQIIKNYIAFVGNDDGVYVLKSFNYSSDDKLNVERLDDPIRDNLTSLVSKSTNVLSAITNNQYFLYIETDTQNYVYRFYHEYGVWVRDTIPLSFKTLETLNNTVTASSTNDGMVYKVDDYAFVDGVDKRYIMKIVSKDFNFNMPHHRKKLKQYQLITKLSPITTIMVNMYADNNLLSSSPLGFDPNQNADAQKLTLMTSGRFRYVKTEITINVREAVQLIGYGFVFKQNTPK